MNCYNLKSLFMFLFYCVKNFLIRLQQKKLYCKKFSELGLLRRILFSYWLLQFLELIKNVDGLASNLKKKFGSMST